MCVFIYFKIIAFSKENGSLLYNNMCVCNCTGYSVNVIHMNINVDNIYFKIRNIKLCHLTPTFLILSNRLLFLTQIESQDFLL